MRATTFVAVVAAAALLGLPAGARAQDRIGRRTIDKRPAVEQMVVSFPNAVLVGDRFLMGKYLIEHDTDRMARGEPCTYVYAYADQRLPVVAFHCTHLTRERHAHQSVTLISDHRTGLKRFAEFQFAGEVGGHGVPVLR